MAKTIIAGPCSVESHEQLREVTSALAAIPQVAMIRAGVWKPRTRPGGFEGLGEPALRWMHELAQEFGVRYCCEVARPEHVEVCVPYGIYTVEQVSGWERSRNRKRLPIYGLQRLYVRM